MKALIQHLLTTARGVNVHGIKNCHVMGLDSIALVRTKDQCAIRLFVARPEHELWKNHPDTHGERKMTVGYHAHHCDVTLVQQTGTILNLIAERYRPEFYIQELPGVRYLFYSAIKNGGSPMMKEDAVDELYLTEVKQLTNHGRFMPSTTIHTVHVERGEPASWFVFEGAEDPGYQAYCWTNNNELAAKPNKHLYQPMSKAEVKAALAMAELV